MTSSTFEQAREFFLRGLEHFQAGRLEQAEAQFAASLSLLPGRASTLTNLGAVRVRLGRHEDALPLLEEALLQEPDNIEALAHRALALAETDHPRQAVDACARLLELAPQYGRGWGLRGRLLKELGHPDEAIAALERAIELGSEVDINRYMLAGLRGGDAPHAPPDEYVQALFDSYAGAFDEHLVQVLRYRGPQILLEPLQRRGLQVERALDLGCGTGLCGPWLRRMARHVAGVDLSPAMLERARATGCYDELSQGELVRWLRTRTLPAQLIVAADVFVYVGVLDAVFAALDGTAVAGCALCFSVESHEGPQDCVLRPSLRYAHSRGGIERLAGAHGWRVEQVLAQPVREDQGQPIPGLYFWLRKA